MKTQIITTELKLNISGFSGVASNKDYAGTAFALMGKIWPLIKSKGLKHKGLNIWIYEPGDNVFAGVELDDPPAKDTGMELETLSLQKYAYYKHIGPYNQLKQAGDMMKEEMHQMGLKPRLPYIEIYGHWTNDETKLETELLMAFD